MNEDARPSRPPRPAAHYLHGEDGPVAVVTGRAAAWLEDRAGLHEARVRHRGEDAGIDAVMLALAVAAAAWRSSARGTGTRNQAEPVAQCDDMNLTSRQVADAVGVTPRCVRKAAAAGRLRARRDPAGHWLVGRGDLDRWRATRTA